MALQKLDQAHSEAEAAVRLDNSSALALGARCVVYYLQEQLPEAHRDCTSALLASSSAAAAASAAATGPGAVESERMRAETMAVAQEQQQQEEEEELRQLLGRIETDIATQPLHALSMVLFGSTPAHYRGSSASGGGDGAGSARVGTTAGTKKVDQLPLPSPSSLPWFLRAEAAAALAARNETDGDSGAGTSMPMMFEMRAAVRQFFLGERGGGAPAHPHSHAVNSLAWGTKRWRLWPPAGSYFAAASPWQDWEQKQEEEQEGGTQGAAALECTQEAGDIVFVPASWGHAVLNVRDSVGMTVEFDVRRAGEEL